MSKQEVTKREAKFEPADSLQFIEKQIDRNKERDKKIKSISDQEADQKQTREMSSDKLQKS